MTGLLLEEMIDEQLINLTHKWYEVSVAPSMVQE